MRVFATVLIVLFAGLAAAYGLFTGPRHLSRYPDAQTSPYSLPFPEGKTYWCVQSNRGIVSHRGRQEFAYDFGMPVGSTIVAARGGKVVDVEMRHDGHGYHWPNNRVVIEHEDGTRAYYLHIRKAGGLVKVGDIVKQGQPISESGHVGNSMMPHLHFHVTSADRKGTMPVSFHDVTHGRGVPRMFKRYTSGNKPA